MIYKGNKVEDLKIAYIGGGSRGWAWGLMSDLSAAEDISGTVRLYDIDKEAAEKNAVIGAKYNTLEGAKSKWSYETADTLDDALEGADFVIISILPGTFDEMESDVHTPEKYGIYQSVGDTSGPGGIVRALRTIPMFEEFAAGIKKNCPNAWVINYTNPMTVCVRSLYKSFPRIKAFGCCHEVFGTQKLLAHVLEEMKNTGRIRRSDIKVNVVGVNHFTWLTSAKYKNIDIFPVYRDFVAKYKDTGYGIKSDNNWMNNSFASEEMVKMDLFDRYGYIAAAGDRHLAEFCEGAWYLKDPETVESYHFGLTKVSWRKQQLKERLAESEALVSGEKSVSIRETGEEGVNQIRALLGLCDLVTNVNIPNMGQIPNLPKDAVVETNAVFRADSLSPVFAGEIPAPIYPLIARISGEQELVAEAAAKKDLNMAFEAFVNDPLVTVSVKEARALFIEMLENTREYLGDYDIEAFKRS